MKRDGKPSWRFASQRSQTLHALLFIRDVLRLHVDGVEGTPPLVEVEAEIAAMNASDRADAAQQWPSWWHTIVAWEAKQAAPLEDEDIRERLQRMAAEAAQIIDPPSWASLSDRPALRVAAQRCFDEGLRWRRPSTRRDSTGLPWQLVQEVADALIQELDISPDALKGCALLLDVNGLWWHLESPGVVLCSTAVAEDRETSVAVLRAAFRSSAS